MNQIQKISMHLLLIFIFAGVYPAVHLANEWLFKFFEMSPNIAWVYLPAFLRLANVFILGLIGGTLATLLGGAMLMSAIGDHSAMGWLNNLCSAGGPVIALFVFKIYRKRDFELTSLKDLTFLILIYALSNALLHHAMWSVLDTSKLVAPIQVMSMVTGDIAGALTGAYLMKWGITWYRNQKMKHDLLN